MEQKIEIKTVGMIGAGAVGAYFLWGMRNLPREDICLIARGERKERLQKEGMIINGERFLYPVKTPEEAAGVDLLLITTKYGALPGLLEDIKTVVKPQTAVLSLLNGVDSEEIIGEAIGEEHMLYSLMRISSERNGNIIFFDPKETRGMWFGEKGIHQITPRAQAVLDLFAQTDCRCTWKEDIMAELWYKYAINISHNLPQAVLGVGLGCYEDSEHMSFLARKLWGEVMAVADARGIATRDYTPPCCSRKNAHLSTLQDLLAKRHTEIDMFAGAMIRMGKEAGIPVPYCEYTFHAIKALEEKNDGKFDYS